MLLSYAPKNLRELRERKEKGEASNVNNKHTQNRPRRYLEKGRLSMGFSEFSSSGKLERRRDARE